MDNNALNFINNPIKIPSKYNGYKYGIGIEHEMYFFHNPSLSAKEAPIKNIILAPTEAYQYMLSQKKLTIQHKNVILSVPYEPTGRICNGKVVLKSLPGVWATKERMPEFITDNPISVIGDHPLKMFDYSNELRKKTTCYLRIMRKYLNKYVKNKVSSYGMMMEPPFGMCSHIKLPNNYKAKTYKFRKGKFKDYTGSYHVTLTLPYKDDMKLDDFIEQHANFANMVQWIEPLMMTGYFSADDRSMGTQKVKAKGSFRVMRVGWGNFGGSDIRKLNKGIGRYANITPFWRKGLTIDEQKLVNYCKELSPSLKKKEPGAISGFSSDFRTFGNTDPKRPDHRESGTGMTIGNGIEIRIFDHFPTKYLNSLLQLLGCLAENSRVHKCKRYVYKDKDWIHAMHEIMINGWVGTLRSNFIKKLRTNLGLRINTSSLQAYEIMKTIYDELFERRIDGDFAKILLGNLKKNELPRINQKSWEFGLSLKLNNSSVLLKTTNRFLKSLNRMEDISNVKKKFFNVFSKKNWDTSFIQFIYYLESLSMINIDKSEKQEIKNIYVIINELDFIRINTFISQECSTG
tara:strand:+ start:1370 stop:3088 length:1719 start_codon:yes stop_codon:yes gene_type:complete